MNKPYQQFLDNVTVGIQNWHLIVSCGAGISYPSGLPTPDQMVKFIISITKLTKK